MLAQARRGHRGGAGSGEAAVTVCGPGQDVADGGDAELGRAHVRAGRGHQAAVLEDAEVDLALEASRREVRARGEPVEVDDRVDVRWAKTRRPIWLVRPEGGRVDSHP